MRRNIHCVRESNNKSVYFLTGPRRRHSPFSQAPPSLSYCLLSFYCCLSSSLKLGRKDKKASVVPSLDRAGSKSSTKRDKRKLFRCYCWASKARKRGLKERPANQEKMPSFSYKHNSQKMTRKVWSHWKNIFLGFLKLTVYSSVARIMGKSRTFT